MFTLNSANKTNQKMTREYYARVSATEQIKLTLFEPDETSTRFNGLRDVIAAFDVSGSMSAHQDRLLQGIRLMLAAGTMVIAFGTSACLVRTEEDGSFDEEKLKAWEGWMSYTNYEAALDLMCQTALAGIGNSTEAKEALKPPILCFITDGAPNRGEHARATKRLEERSLPVMVSYFGEFSELTTQARKTLVDIDHNSSPTAIKATDSSLKSYVQSILKMRLDPYIDHVNHSVRIANMKFEIVDNIPDDSNSQLLPGNLELETTLQMVTCALAYMRSFGTTRPDIAQEIVREVALHVGRHAGSQKHGLLELLAALRGVALSQALMAQRSLPASSDKKVSNLRALCGLVTGSKEDPEICGVYDLCVTALMNNPPLSFGQPRVQRKAAAVANRALLANSKSTKKTHEHISQLMTLPFPHRLFGLSVHTALSAALLSLHEDQSAPFVCAAGNSPWSVKLEPNGGLRVQTGFSDLAPSNTIHLVLIPDPNTNGTLCQASLMLTASQLIALPPSTQSMFSYMTLLFHRYHDAASAEAFLVVLDMMRAAMRELPSPPYGPVSIPPTRDVSFDYGLRAQQGMSPLVHALHSFFSVSSTDSIEPLPTPQQLLELMLLFFHRLNVASIVSDAPSFVPTSPPTRTMLISALESKEGNKAISECFGALYLLPNTLPHDVVNKTMNSVREERCRAAVRTPAGIWPGHFSEEEIVRILRLIFSIANRSFSDLNERARIAQNAILIPNTELKFPNLLSTCPEEVSVAFTGAMLILAGSHALLGADKSAPDIREFLGTAGVSVDAKGGVLIRNLPFTGPALSVLNKLVTERFRTEVEHKVFTVQEYSLFLGKVETPTVLDQVEKMVLGGHLHYGDVSMSTCIEFLRRGYSGLCRYVSNIRPADVLLISPEQASAFLLATAIPHEPSDGNLIAVADLITKASSESVTSYLSRDDQPNKLSTIISLFALTSRHPLPGIRTFLRAIADEVKKTAEVAVSLFTYNDHTLFVSWSAEDIRRCLTNFHLQPNQAQIKLLNILQSSIARHDQSWHIMLAELDKTPYQRFDLQLGSEDVEVAARWATYAGTRPPSTAENISDDAIMNWVRSKNRFHDFDELRRIVAVSQNSTQTLDELIMWRRSRSDSPRWTHCKKDRLVRHTRLLSLTRLARWNPVDHAWKIPTRVFTYAASAAFEVHPDSEWLGKH